MADYYNPVTGTSVPIMVEDVQQICDGQNIQLVVEDMNNCANGTPQYITYATTPQQSETGLFHQPSILGNQLIGVPLDQRQNVYIIKTTNDLHVQQNALKTDVIHANLSSDGPYNIVGGRGFQYVIAGSKLVANNIHEVQQPQQLQQQPQQQQIQWVMPENNINYEVPMKPAGTAQKMTPTVKTPQQRTAQSLTLQTPEQCTTPSATHEYTVATTSDKKPVKYHKTKPRGGVSGGGPGRTSFVPTNETVAPSKNSPQTRQKMFPKPSPQQQQSPLLPTPLTSETTPAIVRGIASNNGRNNLGMVYQAKTFVGAPVSNAMTLNSSTTRQQQLPTIGSRSGMTKTTDAIGKNPMIVPPALKSMPAVHIPHMNALSERIKQEQMKKILSTSQSNLPSNSTLSSPVGASPRAPIHGVLPQQPSTPQIQRSTNSGNNVVSPRMALQIANNEKTPVKQAQMPAAGIQQRRQTANTTIQTPTTTDQRQNIDVVKKQSSMSCQQNYQRDTGTIANTASDNEERMEVDSGNSESGNDGVDGNNVGQDGQTDNNRSASIAYLQKTIDNPQTTVVQHQIIGNTVKMLVVLANGEQRLITFDIPNEPCTVLDLLEQANISFGEETCVSLVSDRILGINYIVEGGTHMANCQDVPETSESYPTSDNLPVDSSPNYGASDENSNSSVTQNEEPKYIEGKVAICPNCGISSIDFNRCARCKKRLPDNVKSMAMVTMDSNAKETKVSVDNFYKKSNEQNSLLKAEPTVGAKRGKGGRRPAAKKRPVKEPECLIISSDEEDDGSGKRKKSDSKMGNASSLTVSMANSTNDEPDTIHEKEPVITNTSSSPSTEQTTESEDGSMKGGGREDQNIDDNPTNQPHAALHCRTVRIGSYKYVPREPIVISQSGVRFAVPLLEDERSFVNLDVKFKDIIRVLIHFGKMMPVLFFYTSVSTGAMIREVLGMQDTKGPYYDPAGKDHTHKRITLLPEKLTEESKLILKNLFTPNGVLIELNPKEANDILVRASPKDQSHNSQSTRGRQTQSTGSGSNTNGGEIQIMTVYPPPPAKGGIAINTEDYICLGVDQFLNDAIIDFYLRYLTLEVLSENDHNRTHVFSSYFYKRLTSPHAQSGDAQATMTAAARRHARVQKWTKNVNIFEKDFIIIPINEHAHWFLAIICYPGLVGKVIVPPTPTKDSPAKTTQKSKKLKELKLQAVTIGNTTITPVATTITIDQADEGSERDEAEGDDEEMEVDSDEDEEPSEESSPPFTPETSDMEERSIVKLPCILIFDSLAGASRSRVVATLRDYLSCEHIAKVGMEKTFSKDTIKGSSPKVPQQSNFTDCGLYLLQYVESFFTDPIKDYTCPIKTLKNWFEEIVVTRKREELAKLLVRLMNQTKGDKTIVMPIVQFPTQAGKLKAKPEQTTESKNPKADSDGKKKVAQQPGNVPGATSSVDDKTKIVAVGTSNVQSNPDNSNEKEVVTRTVYQIVSSQSSTDSSTSEAIFDAKPRSSSCTLSYLRNKRIPRHASRDQESQDNQAGAAKKAKGENDSITKSSVHTGSSSSSSISSSSGSINSNAATGSPSIVSSPRSVSSTNYDSCK